MICETVRDRLMEYLDRELEPAVEKEVQEHLGSCLECRREMVVFRDLKEEAARLQISAEPSTDLWPDIERRLERQGPAGTGTFLGSWSFRLLAAAAMLALLVGSSLWLQMPESEQQVAATRVVTERQDELADRANQARVESGVLQLRKDLLGELDRRRDELEPETWYAIEASLRVLDEAIGEIHLALDANPEDQRLNHLLATRYRQELDFLRRIARA